MHIYFSFVVGIVLISSVKSYKQITLKFRTSKREIFSLRSHCIQTMPSFSNNTSLPLSFRSKGGSKYPPRYSENAPHHHSHASSTNMMSNTANLQIPGYTQMKMDITPVSQITHTNSLANRQNVEKLSLTSSRLSQKRVNKLSDVLAREQQKGQMGKQQAIITQQYIQKYAKSSSRAVHQAQSHCIKKLISGVFSSLDGLASASQLYQLEQSVKSACAKVPDEIKEYKRSFQEGRNPPAKVVPKLSLNDDNSKREIGSLPGNIKDDWTALTIANAIDFEEKKKFDVNRDKERKNRQRENLNKQMEEVKERKMQELEEGMRERNENKRRYNDYMKQEEERMAKEKVQNEKLREMYSSQLMEKRERKEREIARAKEEARKEAASLQRQINKTREEALANKRSEKERYQQMQVTSAANENYKKKLKDEEAALDKKLHEEYTKREEANEARRRKDLNDRKAKSDAIGSQWATTGAGAAKAEEERKMMEIIAREAKLKEDRDDLRSKRDKEKIAADKILMKKLNEQLMEEKRFRNEKERERDRDFALAAKLDNDEKIRQEAVKQKLRKDKTIEYKSSLVLQKMEQDRQYRAVENSVSETERAMNRREFEKLHQDAEMVEKIRNRYTKTSSARNPEKPEGKKGGKNNISPKKRSYRVRNKK